MNRPDYRSANLTISGRRPSNEDSVVDVRLPDGRHLVAVADGLGGHQSGEVASALALEVLLRELRDGRDLADAVAAANAAIHAEAMRDPTRAGMGTTLVALLREGRTYRIANVGDSRAYRIGPEGISQVTRDHSFAAEAVSSKLMSTEEIARSPWRNALTRSLGTQGGVEVDLFGPFEVGGPGHLILLCSDGIYRAVSDEEMRETLLSVGDISIAAQLLSSRAFEQGSDDNMSVALIEFGRILTPTRKPAAAAAPAPPAARAAEPALRELAKEPVARSAPWPSAEAVTMAAPVPHPFAPPRWLRRGLSLVGSDHTLFGLSIAILLLWLLLHLAARS